MNDQQSTTVQEPQRGPSGPQMSSHSIFKKLRLPASVLAIAAACSLLSYSMFLLQGHYSKLRDVRERGLPLAAQIPSLEKKVALLTQQTELSALEASTRASSAEEQLHVFVLPAGGDMHRLLPFLESMRTFLERRKLLQSMSPIEIGEPTDTKLPADAPASAKQSGEGLQSRPIHFSMTVRPEGRAQVMAILEMSGMLTVGDALSPEDIAKLFTLTESDKYASIVPFEQFLANDLLAYLQAPRVYDERLAQALSSSTLLSSFRSLVQSSRLPQVRDYLLGDLGRALIAQKLWPVQLVMVEKETLEELPGGWERVELTLRAYSRKS